MLNSSLLFVTLTPTSAELIKNLCLAGIPCSLFDDRVVSEEMVGGHLFLQPCDVGAKVADCSIPRIQELNPHGKVLKASSIDVTGYSIVISSMSILSELENLTAQTKGKNISFVTIDTFCGIFSTACISLASPFSYRKETGKDTLSDSIEVDFPPMTDVLSFKDFASLKDRFGPVNSTFVKWVMMKVVGGVGLTADKVKGFLVSRNLPEDYLGGAGDVASGMNETSDASLPHIAAVFAGLVGQEIIKAVSGKGEPARNMLVFDGLTGEAKSFKVGCV